MGFLGFLFPSDADKVEKARGLVEVDPARALHLVNGLEVEGSDTVRAAARGKLKARNIEVAVGCANAREFEEAREHLDLAARFADKGDSQVKAARKEVAILEKTAPKPKARSMGGGSDPFGGGAAMPVAGEAIEGEIEAEGDDDLWSLPPDDPRVRFALLLETYPEELRERLAGLGQGFAEAVVDIDDGKAEKALKRLGSFVGKEPAARFERARAAQAAGNLALAGSDLATFGETVGHMTIGGVHTGALLAQILAEQGRLPEALTAVEKALESDVGSVPLRGTRASLLEGVGRFAEADEVARNLVREVPSDMGLYKLMARCRVQGDKRIEAMQVLESGLKTNCTTGNCGSQGFDVDAGRLLARLYLEDQIEPRRARDLVMRVKANVQQATWFENYLDVLTARNDEEEDALDQARALLPPTDAPETDPRRRMVLKAFPELAPTA